MRSSVAFWSFLAVTLLGAARAACADDSFEAPPAPTQAAEAGGAGAQHIRDPRLPPVLPGEEVRVGDTEMKLWSTSGPVPGSEAPRAPGVAGSEVEGLEVNELNVLVDRRSDSSRAPREGR